MATRVTRRPGAPDWLSEVTRKAAQWAQLRATEKTTKQRVEILKGDLKTLVRTYGEADENGHVNITLPVPIESGNETYTGLKAERHVSTSLDEDKVEEILKEKGLFDQVQSQEVITYIDQDKLYALQQQGFISEEELDSMWVENETYHFKGQK